MGRIGYARVSSLGQSLEVQVAKLKKAGCVKIFKEKKSGTNILRPEFKACMDYLREEDTLVITRLDRLARSVFHLSEIAKRFHVEGINLITLDQNINTTTSEGRLMFNMLATIGEFENDLRSERQREGIENAKAKGIKFGRPPKVSAELKKTIFKERSNSTINQLAKKYHLGVATIYRILAEMKE